MHQGQNCTTTYTLSLSRKSMRKFCVRYNDNRNITQNHKGGLGIPRSLVRGLVMRKLFSTLSLSGRRAGGEGVGLQYSYLLHTTETALSSGRVGSLWLAALCDLTFAKKVTSYWALKALDSFKTGKK